MAVLTGIELCAGVGMLGEGVRAALGFLGHEYRTICYVEREAAAAGQLVTLMEAGIIDPAPCWSDMLTFDGAAWRGRVDCLVAGFPCQDLSIAGRRAGLDGERSGLFFRICDIADDCGAQFLILENVSAIASAAATVVDETEGELEERAAARVMGELADRGWDSEWITLSASDVGASHRRARWFCFAWRMADTRRSAPWRQQYEPGTGRESAEHQPCGEAVGHAGLQHQQLQQRAHGAEHQGAGGNLGNSKCSRWPQAGSRPDLNAEREPEPRCCYMAQPKSIGRNKRRSEPAGKQGRPNAAEHGSAVADTAGQHGDQRLRQRKRPTAAARGESGAEGRGEGMANTISPRPQIRNGGGQQP